MDRRKIYDLLCEVIKEAELGKKECIRDDFEEWRLCNHAWENIESLVDKISETIMWEDRTMIKLRREESLTKVTDSKNYPIHNFTESNDVTGISGEADTDGSFEDIPFPGVL